jgi:hypothetical protein
MSEEYSCPVGASVGSVALMWCQLSTSVRYSALVLERATTNSFLLRQEMIE